MAFTFGVATAPGSYGDVQNFRETKSIEEATARDENGDVSAMETYNLSTEVSFEYVFDGTAPTPGTDITIGGAKYRVLTAELTESNTDFKRLAVTAKRYDTNTIPA